MSGNDSDSTPGVLDGDFYPHIVDDIFQYALATADMSVWAALRNVSGDINDHINAIWTHAVLDDHGLRDVSRFKGRPAWRTALPPLEGYPRLLDVRRTHQVLDTRLSAYC